MRNRISDEIKKSLEFVAHGIITGGKNGARSALKVDNIHEAVAAEINSMLAKENLSSKFTARCKNINGGEMTVSGAWGGKKADVWIVDTQSGDDSKVVAVIEVKMPLTSIGRNKGTYIEGMVGEAANIMLSSKLYYQIWIMPNVSPNPTGSKKYEGPRKEGKVIRSYDKNIAKDMYDKLESIASNRSFCPNAILEVSFNNLYVESSMKKPVSMKEFSNKQLMFLENLGENDFLYKDKKAMPGNGTLFVNDYRDFIKQIVSELKDEAWRKRQ